MTRNRKVIRENERDAAKETKKLEKQASDNTSNRRGITRRQMLGLLGAGLGLATIGGIYASWRKEEAPNEHNPQPDNEREGAIDRLIANVESEFPRLKGRLTQKVAAQGGLPSYLNAEELYSPFALVQVNATNSRKNKTAMDRQMRAQSQERAVIRQDNVYHFSYGIISDQVKTPAATRERMAAGFSPLDRAMYLNGTFDSRNPVDALVLYHELRHGAQDANSRARIQNQAQFDRYESFFKVEAGQRPRIVITEEMTSYAYELEVMNILLDGRLRTGSLSLADAVRVLGARSDQQPTVELLYEFAKSYFPSGMMGGTFSKGFIEKVESSYREAGYDLYVPTSDGGLRKID